MNLLDKIKAVFKAHEEVITPAEVKNEELTLSDGTTKISVSSLEPGASIEVIDAEGNKMPANPGDYALEDGRILIVEEAGVIAVIKEAKLEEEAKTPEPAKEDLTEINNSIVFLAEKIKALEDSNSKVKIENEKLKKENEALKIVPSPKAKEVKFKKLAEKEIKLSKYAKILMKK